MGWGAQNPARWDRDPKKRPICQEEGGKGECTQRWDCHRSMSCVSKSMDLAVLYFQGGWKHGFGPLCCKVSIPSFWGIRVWLSVSW